MTGELYRPRASTVNFGPTRVGSRGFGLDRRRAAAGPIALLDAGGGAARISLTIRLEKTMIAASTGFLALLIHSLFIAGARRALIRR